MLSLPSSREVLTRFRNLNMPLPSAGQVSAFAAVRGFCLSGHEIDRDFAPLRLGNPRPSGASAVFGSALAKRAASLAVMVLSCNSSSSTGRWSRSGIPEPRFPVSIERSIDRLSCTDSSVEQATKPNQTYG